MWPIKVSHFVRYLHWQRNLRCHLQPRLWRKRQRGCLLAPEIADQLIQIADGNAIQPLQGIQNLYYDLLMI